MNHMSWIDRKGDHAGMPEVDTHIWDHGTYPRGYCPPGGGAGCSKKLRDSRRAKNKLARQARTLNHTKPQTSNRSRGR